MNPNNWINWEETQWLPLINSTDKKPVTPPITYSTEKLPPKTVVVFFIKDVGQFFEEIQLISVANTKNKHLPS